MYRVTVTTQAFPPHRQVPGLTDQTFQTFDAARVAVRKAFVSGYRTPYRARPVKGTDDAQTLARWVGRNLADGRVEVAIVATEEV